MTRSFARILAGLVLFGISFGYVEAAVVVYLRAQYQALHQRLYPDRDPGDYFPILTLEQLQAAGPEYERLLYTELAREAATMLMMAAVAVAAAVTFRQWLAAFMVVFGLWDLSYYASMRLLIGWPGSLLDWDLLFLLPVPWVGPVWAPALVALAMVGVGVGMLWRESRGWPVRLTWGLGLAIGVGGLLIVAGFCYDWRNILAGGEPNAFNWRLFAVGLAVAVAGGLAAFAARPPAARGHWSVRATGTTGVNPKS
jgi:hypothetical protein